MKTVFSALTVAFRVFQYLASFSWNVVLPFIGLQPYIDRSRAIMLGSGVALIWAYWIALAVCR